MSKYPELGAAAAALILSATALPAVAQDAPAPSSGFDVASFDVSGIGRAPTDEEIAGWDIDIRSDGEGLPEGRGTVLEGEDLFVMYCSACHGDFGEGAGRWPVLAGGYGTLDSDDPNKTVGSYWPYVTTLLDYTYRAMPYGFGQSLQPDELYAISAYILYLNDIILDEEFELSHENVMEVEMPNADGFIPDDREVVEAHFWQEDPCMENCAEGTAEIIMRAVDLDVTPEGGGAGAPGLD